MNFDTICRCCLTDGKILSSIWNSSENKIMVKTIAETLAYCLNIQVQFDDGYPQNICEHCLNQLNSIMSFKSIVENSKKILVEYLEKNLDTKFNIIDSKSEHPDNFIDKSEVDSYDGYKSDNSSSKVNIIESYSMPCKDESKLEANDHFPQNEFHLYYCTDCDSKFIDHKDLSQHCSHTHKRKKTPGKCCDYCYRRFEDSKSLDEHKKHHVTPFVCDGCSQCFLRAVDRDLHKETCTTPKLRAVQRNIETVKQKNNEDLNEGKSKKRQDNSASALQQNGRTVCHLCGKSYVTTYINIHMLIHGNEYKYKCEFCDKSLKTRCGLNSHVIFNHQNVRNYKCQFCEQNFKTASGRGYHIKRVHLNQKNSHCTTCGKSFFSKDMLRRHMLCHSGEKNYACEYCEKAYQSRYGLNVHLKKHHTQ